MNSSTCAIQETPANISNVNERERLILENLAQVKIIAKRIHSKIPPGVELSDLVSAGILGLIDAIGKFNPSHKVRLKTFAEHRIRGAMLDSLRNLDWSPRSLRVKSRKLQAVCGALEQSLGRLPTDEEKSDALGIGISEYHELTKMIGRMKVDSLDMAGNNNNQKTQSLSGSIPDSPTGRPSAIFERSEISNIMSLAMDKLPKRERLIISLYYFEELTMREIGEILGVNESRISQMHTNAIHRLKEKLRSLNPVT
jgi:RNA polymerase sigma factor for flagellar operon FliA